MKKGYIYMTLLSALFLCNCIGDPYYSKYMVGEPIEFADQIIGTWSEMENNTTDCHYIIVEKENSEKVFISEFIYDGATGTHEEYNYYGFITKFNNEYFLNAKSSDGYYLYKFVPSADKIKVFPVSKYIKKKFISAYEFEGFVKENMHLGFFYGDIFTLYKN